PECAESAASDLFARADHDTLAFGVEGGDIQRQPVRNAQAMTLTGREVVDAVVLAEHPPVRIDDLATRAPNAVRLEELGDRATGDETDFHAFRLVRIGKTVSARELANLRLGQVSQREPDQRQLHLCQPVQEIALVLRSIARAEELPASVGAPLDARVMS